ncbi:MAG: protein phosphatase 2C domain-containing protein [Halovenus sp.]
MNYATNYDVGDRKRAGGINEDSVAISVFEQGHRGGLQDRGETEDGTPTNRSVAVFALADGAGGHEGGDVASYIATTEICEQLAPVAIGAARSDPSPFGLDFDTGERRASATNLEAAVAEAIVSAHREILSYAADSGIGAYTTVVAGICAGGQLYYGWVGDSRAYVVNEAREEITRLTKDHAVVEELRDAGKIDDVEAHVHPNGNEITRALGGQGHEDPENATVNVETETVALFAEDIVFVTSDGVIDAQTDAPTLHDSYLESDRSEAVAETIRERVVTDDKLREWILSAGSLGDVTETLIERANERGGKDNLSTILFNDPSLPETPADGGLPVRARELTDPIVDRETVIFSDE